MKEIKKKIMTAVAATMSVFVLGACSPAALTQSANRGPVNTVALKTAAPPSNAVSNSTQALNSQQTTNDAPTTFKREGLSIEEIVKQNIKSVVTVAVTKIENGGIFGKQYQSGVGSGFFISADGLVATNNHVVQGASSVEIILNDGTRVKGQVAWASPQYDVAVVKIDKSVPVPGVVTIGNSDNVQVGEEVVAIGNPMSEEFAGTVTNGIISAKNRKIMVGGREFNYLQTNAAINGGNSGGPLFNSRGEVIGINSAKITELAIEGISFAIPINTFMKVLASNGNGSSTPSVNQTIIGIELVDITAESQASAKQKYNLNLPKGILITNVVPNSPAEQAGLLTDDIIVQVDGKQITQGTELNAIKSTHKAGDTMKMVIYRYRDNKYYEVNVVLAPRN